MPAELFHHRARQRVRRGFEVDRQYVRPALVGAGPAQRAEQRVALTLEVDPRQRVADGMMRNGWLGSSRRKSLTSRSHSPPSGRTQAEPTCTSTPGKSSWICSMTLARTAAELVCR